MDYRDNVKLIDFGLGNTFVKDKDLKTSCGSPCFAAPEIINGIKYDPVKIDIWSLGVSLYCMLCGSLPFDDDSKKELYKKIRSGKYYVPDYLTPSALNLLKMTINLDPEARPSAEDLLSHQFFSKVPKAKIPNIETIEIDDNAAYLAADMMKLPLEVIKTMVANNDLSKQTTVYYLLLRRAERGCIDLMSERKKIEKEKREEIAKLEKKEQKYRKVLEESLIDKQKKGSMMSKIRNLTSRRCTDLDRSRQDFNLDSRSRSRVIKLDESLFNNRTERPTDKTPIISLVPSRLGSSRAVKHQRNSLLSQNNKVNNSISMKAEGLQRDSSTGSGKSYLLRRVQPRTSGRAKLRESFNPSQSIEMQYRTTVNNSGGPDQIKKKTSSAPKKPMALFDRYRSNQPSPMNQDRSLSTSMAETFKIVPKNKAVLQPGASREKTEALSKLIKTMAPRKINITIGNSRDSYQDRDTVM